jgi:hypothetical protein
MIPVANMIDFFPLRVICSWFYLESIYIYYIIVCCLRFDLTMFLSRRFASNKSFLSSRTEKSLQSDLVFAISNISIDDACEPVLSDQILLKQAFKFAVTERRRSATEWREQRESVVYDNLNPTSRVFALLMKSTVLGHESRIQSFIRKMHLVGRKRPSTNQTLQTS